MDPGLRTRLLHSIEAENLVLVCGAGLSMPAPSCIPSAAEVAHQCWDRASAIEELDHDLRDDLGKLAEHYFQLNQLQNFIQGNVPWDLFNGESNIGHAAIADLLICRALDCAISTNYDEMVEKWGRRLRFNFQAAIDGVTATQTNHRHSPYLKFHGCMIINQAHTVWAPSQIQDDPEVKKNVESCKTWIAANLQDKDIVFVGFWSDWNYLNEIFAAALGNSNPSLVVLVDPGEPDWLQEKAPDLWAITNEGDDNFYHVDVSSEVFLNQLRIEFSRLWLKKFYRKGRGLFEDATGLNYADDIITIPDDANADDLYDLRRDSEGVSRNFAAVTREPQQGSSAAAYTHLRLSDFGAQLEGSWWVKDDKRIRIVNGAGRSLSEVKKDHQTPPTRTTADVVICAGSEDYGLPSNISRSGTPGNLIRPENSGNWYSTYDDAIDQEF